MASLQYKANLPKEIQQKIKLLSEHQTQISSLESQLQKARTSYKILESELLEYRVEVEPNATLYPSLLTGIQVLPDEMLLLVFEHFLSVHHRDIKGLLSVCKRWHRVVMSPRFWARIQVFPVDYSIYQCSKHSSALYIEACLQRSQPLLLDIEVDYDYFKTCEGHIRDEVETVARMVADESEEDRIFDWVFGIDCNFSSAGYDQYFYDVLHDLDVLIGPRGVHMERWRSIDLCVPWREPHVAMDVWVKFIGRTPNLKRAKFTGLQVDTFVDIEEADQFDLSFPTLSNLSSLTLDEPGLNIFLTDFTISPLSLQHLDIEYDETLSGISVLSRFPLLRKLSLHTYTQIQDPNPSIIVSVVRLPNLQQLKLFGHSHILLKHLRFDLPNLQDLLVDSGSRSEFYIPSGLSPTHIRWTILNPFKEHWTPEAIRSTISGLFQASDRIETLTVLESVRTTVLEVLSDLRQTMSLPASLRSVVVELEEGGRDNIVVSS